MPKLSKQKALLGAGVVVRDPRFASLHSDPRFQRTFKRKLKVPIDARFRHIFSDKRFSDPLALDKRGRKIPAKRKKNRNVLKKYYHLDEDPEAEEKEVEEEEEYQQQLKDDNQVPAEDTRKSSGKSESSKVGRVSGKNSVSTAEEDSETENDREDDDDEEEQDSDSEEEESNTKTISGSSKRSKIRRVLDKNGVTIAVEGAEEESDSEEEDSDIESDDSDDVSETSSTTSSSSDESDVEAEGLYMDDEPEEENVPTTEKETRRLALVNMDWDHLRAVDILAVMNSFLPKDGAILSVTVYPSEFGLEQMKIEEKNGPKLFSESDESEDEDSELVNEKLRKYEKAKLRYYYAIVECDSIATADFLYKSCDGMEFERTSNTLDLRFVPDDMVFKHDPKDTAKEVPSDYQAPAFETRALQHSKVKLTWDDDEPDRVKTLHQKFDADQLNEMDFKAYLASDDSSSEEEVDDADGNGSSEGGGTKANASRKAEKYRALLLGTEEKSEDKGSDSDKDLEITFNSGLEELSKRLIEKKKQKTADETVWKAYLRKKKEKRKAQKQQKLAEDGDDTSDENNDDNLETSQDNLGFDDPFFNTEEGDIADEGSNSEDETPVLRPKKSAKKEKKSEIEERKREEERSRAELELLLADEHGVGNSVKGYNLKKKLKGKKKDKDKDEISEKVPAANYDDPRFSALFSSHHFAIDPTEPEFKRSAAHLRGLVEKQQKRLSQAREESKPGISVPEKGDNPTESKSKQELSLLVKSLKRKVGTKSS